MRLLLGLVVVFSLVSYYFMHHKGQEDRVNQYVDYHEHLMAIFVLVVIHAIAIDPPFVRFYGVEYHRSLKCYQY